MTPECASCHFTRRERDGYQPYERKLCPDLVPCSTCGMTTPWRTGAKLERKPKKAVAA